MKIHLREEIKTVFLKVKHKTLTLIFNEANNSDSFSN